MRNRLRRLRGDIEPIHSLHKEICMSYVPAVGGRCVPVWGCLMGGVLVACLDRPVALATPKVTGRFEAVTNQSIVSKIDVLFMIDDSSSMLDKQEILAAAVPDLLNRLVDPICVNSDGSGSGVSPDAAGNCPPPTQREFEPVKDIHIGIITSSLGGHGAPNVCVGQADMSHLMARSSGTTLPTFQNQGFLNWNPSLDGAYSDPAQLNVDFRTMVTGVGQTGCGYEAQLESVYRFLVDPAPYQSITLSGGIATPQGVDDVVLRQRADFLRPDSLVAVIAISDENDYSIIDGGEGWRAIAHTADRLGMKGGTSACKSDPNAPCCVNCGQPDVPGCTLHAADPACAAALTDATDPINLRASRSKAQYGVDFDWALERYVEGFTHSTLDHFGNGTKNPLFDGVPQRDPSLVFFAGIVGVPWQDIARDPVDLSKGFQTSEEMIENGTWSTILGHPSASPPVVPSDPHMIVSTEPRAGIAGPDSPPGADPKNGHEWRVPSDPNYADLQYACIFPLSKPRDCTGTDTDCDCWNGDVTYNPLCQNGSGAYGKIQYGAKAYPGLRELEFLKGVGNQGIVGSICPKNTTDPTQPDYGYRPAIESIIVRLRRALRNQCLPRALEPDEQGSVPCVVVEIWSPPSGETCRCEGNIEYPGRRDLTPDLATWASSRAGRPSSSVRKRRSPPAAARAGKTSVNPSNHFTSAGGT